MNIEVILSPDELGALSRRDLSAATCVVFDVLRATSSMITALHHGAEAIIPVSWLIKSDGTLMAKAQGIHAKEWFETNIQQLVRED